jgi:hypothetical protein
MRLRGVLLSLSLAVLLNTAAQITLAGSASAFCVDDRGRGDFCYYSDGRVCWVTMSGLGVCVPNPPAPAHRRRVFTERRH